MSKAKTYVSNLRSPLFISNNFWGEIHDKKTNLFIGDPGGGHQRLGLTFPRPTFQAPGSIQTSARVAP
jgi:hypothetical protein